MDTAAARLTVANIVGMIAVLSGTAALCGVAIAGELQWIDPALAALVIFGGLAVVGPVWLVTIRHRRWLVALPVLAALTTSVLVLLSIPSLAAFIAARPAMEAQARTCLEQAHEDMQSILWVGAVRITGISAERDVCLFYTDADHHQGYAFSHSALSGNPAGHHGLVFDHVLGDWYRFYAPEWS